MTYDALAVGQTEKLRREASSARRLPGLDVVRAVAISLVLISHFGSAGAWALGLTFPPGLNMSGAYGVEIFFALSGFLIGGLLIQIVDRDPNLKSWIIFMIRRWMRTLPLYFVWIAVLLVIARPRGDGAWLTVLAHVGLVQNLAWPTVGGNWFDVAWSLMVEEWFYLLFSGALMLVARRWRAQAVLLTCLLFILSPYLFRFAFFLFSYVPSQDWDIGLRKIVVFRLDAIAYGVLIAWLHRTRPAALARWRYAMLVAGLVLVGFTWAPFFGAFHLPQGYYWSAYLPLLSIGAALFLPAALHAKLPTRGWMTPITWLSERSYGLYIVHFSLIGWVSSQFHKHQLSLSVSVVAALALSLILAELSWRFFESRILAARPKQV